MLDFITHNAKEIIMVLFFSGVVLASIRSEQKTSIKRIDKIDEVVTELRYEHSVRKTNCLNEFGEKINSIHAKMAKISEGVEFLKGKLEMMDRRIEK